MLIKEIKIWKSRKANQPAKEENICIKKNHWPGGRGVQQETADQHVCEAGTCGSSLSSGISSRYLAVELFLSRLRPVWSYRDTERTRREFIKPSGKKNVLGWVLPNVSVFSWTSRRVNLVCLPLFLECSKFIFLICFVVFVPCVSLFESELIASVNIDFKAIVLYILHDLRVWRPLPWRYMVIQGNL